MTPPRASLHRSLSSLPSLLAALLAGATALVVTGHARAGVACIALAMLAAATAGALERRALQRRVAVLDDLQRALEGSRRDGDELRRLLDRLPVGLLLATPSGEIRYRNAALPAGTDAPADLLGSLEELTGFHRDWLRHRVHALLAGGGDVCLTGRPGAECDYVLSSIRGGRRSELLLLVCAVRRDADDALPPPLPALSSPRLPRFTSSSSHTIPMLSPFDATTKS